METRLETKRRDGEKVLYENLSPLVHEMDAKRFSLSSRIQELEEMVLSFSLSLASTSILEDAYPITSIHMNDPLLNSAFLKTLLFFSKSKFRIHCPKNM